MRTSSVDCSIAYLLTRRGSMGALGTNGKSGGGRSGGGFSYGGGRRELAQDIIRGTTGLVTGITEAIASGRRSRRPAARPAVNLPDPGAGGGIGEGFRVEGRTPWGGIAIGGAALFIILGMGGYIVATRGKKS